MRQERIEGVCIDNGRDQEVGMRLAKHDAGNERLSFIRKERRDDLPPW